MIKLVQTVFVWLMKHAPWPVSKLAFFTWVLFEPGPFESLL